MAEQTKKQIMDMLSVLLDKAEEFDVRFKFLDKHRIKAELYVSTRPLRGMIRTAAFGEDTPDAPSSEEM